MDEKVLDRLSLFVQWRKGNVAPSKLDSEMNLEQITADLELIICEYKKINEEKELYKKVYLTTCYV